ncbi:MAG: hypothetical protein LBJ61_08475 [Deltaproteobacteria bacterium]|jgi:hypothetical protein|nr:hypothetical protein [Deltaproteobacteria bacterium]
MPTSSNTQRDSQEIPRTLEDAMKLLGLKDIPGLEDLDNPDPDLKRLFLEGLASYIQKKGLDWVKANRDTVMMGWEALLVTY